MIGSFASGATASLVAKNGTKKLSQLFVQNFKLITPILLMGPIFCLLALL